MVFAQMHVDYDSYVANSTHDDNPSDEITVHCCFDHPSFLNVLYLFLTSFCWFHRCFVLSTRWWSRLLAHLVHSEDQDIDAALTWGTYAYPPCPSLSKNASCYSLSASGFALAAILGIFDLVVGKVHSVDRFGQIDNSSQADSTLLDFWNSSWCCWTCTTDFDLGFG